MLSNTIEGFKAGEMVVVCAKTNAGRSLFESNMLKQATAAQLIEAERLAIKYTPSLALAIAKELFHRKS